MTSQTIKFKKLHKDAIVPTRGTENSAGFDLYALQDTLVIGGEGSVIVPTGIAVQLPPGTYGRIAARSGASVREHLAVSAGVIDLDYLGGIGIVAFVTKNKHEYLIKKGERFAQLIPELVSYLPGEEVTEIIPQFVAHEGWGSTGKK